MKYLSLLEAVVADGFLVQENDLINFGVITKGQPPAHHLDARRLHTHKARIPVAEKMQASVSPPF